MTGRFTFVVAVYALVREGDQILLARRCNTGYKDGEYGVPAGHLDGGEDVYVGLARELREEIGIEVNPAELAVVHIMQRRTPDGQERFEIFLEVTQYTGTIINAEPHKCDDLRFFSLAALPDNTIDYIRAALGAIAQGEYLSVRGYSDTQKSLVKP
jgi:8-oxo-dGTP pyrophosphatase MutT (NUDIX family)